MRIPVNVLNHLAFWFVTLFATPLFIAANNGGDIVIKPLSLLLILAAACLTMTFLSWGLGRMAGPLGAQRIGLLLAGLALLLAIQCNLVHDRFFYGHFNGEAVNFRTYGRVFWYEWYGFLATAVLITALLQWFRPRGIWLGLLPIASSSLLLLSALGQYGSIGSESSKAADFDDAAFTFSRQGNLIHLLPDGFQSDIAEQVLKENPELAARFEGFTLFSNHLGMFQGTAPAVPTLLTGQAYDLSRGHNYEETSQQVKTQGYPAALKESGYRLDYALISGAYCDRQADSCVVRPFNDMKARGYFRHQHTDALYSLRILADLSLFRLFPMWVKEKIYDDGHWTVADTGLDGSSPWPDPIIREWSDHLRITDGPPVYKFYHYIGTHIPPHWDQECRYHRNLDRSRENYAAQTYCVLQGIANLVDALKAAGVYEQTAIVVTGDHGCAIAPEDHLHAAQLSPLTPAMMGSARPAFMVKQKHARQPLRFSSAPTSLTDVAPTAMALAGLPHDEPSAFDFHENVERTRYYRPYSIRDFFTGDPVPHVVYALDGDVRDSRNWLIEEIHAFRTAPSSFDPVNHRQAGLFVQGARFSAQEPDKDASWVNGRQLAFLISQPGEAAGEPVLKFALHLPPWIPEQQMRIQVNGHAETEWLPIEMGKGYWTQVSVALDPGQLKPENNFVSVRFAQSHLPPSIEHWEAAALLRSIRLVRILAPDTSTSAAGLP